MCKLFVIFLKIPSFSQVKNLDISQKSSIFAAEIKKMDAMKTKILKAINYLITLLIGPLAMTGCYVKYGCPPEDIIGEYGCPYAEFKVSGTVMDKDSNAVENIRVTVHNHSNGGQIMPEAYSEEDGKYTAFYEAAFPVNNVDIIAHDTAGVYVSDTVRNVEVTFTGGDGNWNYGETSIEQDFVLKKKE